MEQRGAHLINNRNMCTDRFKMYLGDFSVSSIHNFIGEFHKRLYDYLFRCKMSVQRSQCPTDNKQKEEKNMNVYMYTKCRPAISYRIIIAWNFQNISKYAWVRMNSQIDRALRAWNTDEKWTFKFRKWLISMRYKRKPKAGPQHFVGSKSTCNGIKPRSIAHSVSQQQKQKKKKHGKGIARELQWTDMQAGSEPNRMNTRTQTHTYTRAQH